MPLSDKITNIIGVALPDWIIKQLKTRSKQGSLETRNDNRNLIYLEGKNAWIRLVSSVNLRDKEDRDYFSQLGVPITGENSLAKQYVLFGGTSIYLDKNYKLRSGISGITPGLPANEGQYSPLGTEEIRKFGFRPMPGITNVTIETQGRLGSVRSATVNFKCWDKDQLDIMDALYFKLGYTMFLEWGQTNFFKDGLKSSEYYSIDPFEQSLTKEEINRRIGQNNVESEGNYDAMLGIVMNFNFSYNQEGGYDCTIKLISLGILAESIKINNSTDFPNILTGVLSAIKEKERIRRQGELEVIIQNKKGLDITKFTLEELIDNILEIPPNALEINRKDSMSFKNTYTIKNRQTDDYLSVYDLSISSEYGSSGFKNVDNYNIAFDVIDLNGKTNKFVALRKFGALLPLFNDQNTVKVKFNVNEFNYLVNLQKVDLYNRASWKQEDFTSGEIFSSDYDAVLQYPSTYNQDRLYLLRISADDNLTVSNKGINQIEKIRPLVTQGQLQEDSVSVTPEEIQLDDKSSLSLANFRLQSIIDQLKIQMANDYWPTKITLLFDGGDINNPYNKQKTLGVLFTTTINVEVNQNANFSYSYVDQYRNVINANSKGDAIYKIPITISYTDTRIISDIKTSALQPLESEIYDKELSSQNQIETPTKKENTEDQTVSAVQSRDSRIPVSALEQILRSIVLHSYTEVDNKKDKVVYEIDLVKKDFYKLIFSQGIFSNFLESLVNGEIPDSKFDSPQSSDEYKFKVYCKYGFATSLLSSRIKLYQNGKKNFNEVDFKKLLRSYVIKYDINPISTEVSNIEQNNINHPVYIPFGTLLMILNSCCSLYDVTNKENKKPIIYIDFNPNHNYCLSCPQQLSINPWKFMIPFQGESNDFLSIFPKDLYQKNSDSESVIKADITGLNYIYPPKNSEFSPEEIFSPDQTTSTNGDYVSSGLLPFKYDGDSDSLSSYRGKVMNVLVNVDYLLGILYDMSNKNDEFKVILKDYVDTILSDMNKTLGNYNSFRLSFFDSANCLQVIDDQYVPTNADERQLYTSTNKEYIELPLLGKESIARSLEIKTEITNRLSSMVAISANATVSKNIGGIDGDSVGFINTGYVDRYISDVGLSNYKENKKETQQNVPSDNEIRKTDGLIQAAIVFNQAVRSIYGSYKIKKTAEGESTPLPKSTINSATNFYLERINDVKSMDPVTKASMMIPVSLNFSTDGISGLAMGYAFTIPEQLIPYTYSNTRKKPLGKSILNKVGFVITDVSNTFENNQWVTSVKANMIYLKDQSVKGMRNQGFLIKSSITQNYNEIIDSTPWSAMFISYVMKEAGIRFPIKDSHIGYLNEIIKNPDKYDVIQLNPNSNYVKKGDIVIRTRSSNVITYSTTGYAKSISHGDIITDFSYDRLQDIKAKGGNLSDSVRIAQYKYTDPVSEMSKYKVLENDQGYRVFAILRLKDESKVSAVIKALDIEFEKWNNPSYDEQDLVVRETIAKYYELVGLKVK